MNATIRKIKEAALVELKKERENIETKKASIASQKFLEKKENVAEEIRKLDPNHIFTKERGFAPGDPRRCRGHRLGPREGFHQMEKEYRILGFVANALEERKDVEIEEKKPVSVDEFKKIMNECLDKEE